MRTYLLLRLAAAVTLAVCSAAASPARAQTTYEQITDDTSESGCGSFLPAASADAQMIAFESTCDLIGENEDGSREIYRYSVAAQTFRQLTDAVGCSSANAVTNSTGSRIAFESDCDLTGGNADGNTEIFLWKQGAGNGTLTQLTTSTACDNLAPTITAGASNAVVAFDTNCLYPGNTDASSEIYRVNESGTLTRLTNDPTGQCDSIAPSGNDAGTLYAYESDCDPLGTNPDFAIEIFTVTSAANPVVNQLTAAGDDACSSLSPSMDDAGAFVAFESDCDFTDDNADASVEIFRVATGSEVVTQLTDDDGGSSCASTRPIISGSGTTVAFSSFCDLAGDNEDESLEAFRVTAGNDPVQVTDGSDCSSVAGSIETAGGALHIDSDCDLAGDNDDESTEIYRALPAVDCNCGDPAPPVGSITATDALAVLRGAVGIGTCPACACDADGNGGVFASDALRVLSKAVGTDVDMLCPAA